MENLALQQEAMKAKRLLRGNGRGVTYEVLRKTEECQNAATKCVKRLYSGAKSRAKDRHMEFDLELSDVLIPSHCPVLGIPLKPGVGTHNAGSPTLDRVNNRRGYVKGNVRVISMRANGLKSNANIDEMELIWEDFRRCHGLCHADNTARSQRRLLAAVGRVIQASNGST